MMKSRIAFFLNNSSVIASCIVISAIVFMFSGTSLASEALSIDEFILSAKDDVSFTDQIQLVRLLENSNPNTPLFREVQFRTETEEFDPTRQTYSLRFYPNAWGAKDAGKQYDSAYLAGNGAQADMLLHDLIKTRYMLVIELIHLLNMKKLNNELMIGYDDSVHVLKESVDSPDFDITDYINIKNSFTDTRLELVKINNDITSINNDILRCLESGGIIKETDPDFIRFDTSDLIGIDAVRRKTAEFLSTDLKDNVHLKVDETELEIEKRKYDLEEAKSKRLIEFFQVSYDADEFNDNKKAFSVGLGIKLPFFGSDNRDLIADKIKILNENRDYENKKRTLSEQISKRIDELGSKIFQYNILKQAGRDGELESLLNIYMNFESSNPMTVIKIKEKILKRDMALETKRYEIYSDYIDLLDVSGKLSEKPLINYLSKFEDLVED